MSFYSLSLSPSDASHVQFLSEKMMKKEPDQALPITAGLVTTTAFFAMVWCLADGWMTNPGWEAMGLPGLFMDADMRTVVREVELIFFMARVPDYLSVINRVALTATDTRAYTHTHTRTIPRHWPSYGRGSSRHH